MGLPGTRPRGSGSPVARRGPGGRSVGHASEPPPVSGGMRCQQQAVKWPRLVLWTAGTSVTVDAGGGQQLGQGEVARDRLGARAAHRVGPTRTNANPRSLGREPSGRTTDKASPAVAGCPRPSVSREVQAGSWGPQACADHRRGGQRYGDLRTTGRAGAATPQAPRRRRAAPPRAAPGNSGRPAAGPHAPDRCNGRIWTWTVAAARTGHPKPGSSSARGAGPQGAWRGGFHAASSRLELSGWRSEPRADLTCSRGPGLRLAAGLGRAYLPIPSARRTRGRAP